MDAKFSHVVIPTRSAAGLVILSRERIENDGPKSACQSSKIELERPTALAHPQPS
jgi:hypothetical protein